MSELEWLEITRVLDTVIEGYDVREEYGIKPKRGTPPTTIALQKWLTLYVLRLVIEEPDVDEKEHVGLVARTASLSDKRLKDIVREHRQELRRVAEHSSLDSIIGTVNLLLSAK